MHHYLNLGRILTFHLFGICYASSAGNLSGRSSQYPHWSRPEAAPSTSSGVHGVHGGQVDLVELLLGSPKGFLQGNVWEYHGLLMQETSGNIRKLFLNSGSFGRPEGGRNHVFIMLMLDSRWIGQEFTFWGSALVFPWPVSGTAGIWEA